MHVRAQNRSIAWAIKACKAGLAFLAEVLEETHKRHDGSCKVPASKVAAKAQEKRLEKGREKVEKPPCRPWQGGTQQNIFAQPRSVEDSAWIDACLDKAHVPMCRPQSWTEAGTSGNCASRRHGGPARLLRPLGPAGTEL